MKKLLLALLLASTANSSNSIYELEYFLLVKETWLMQQLVTNDGYVSLFSQNAVGAAYFRGKADAYRELLSIIEH